MRDRLGIPGSVNPYQHVLGQRDWMSHPSSWTAKEQIWASLTTNKLLSQADQIELRCVLKILGLPSQLSITLCYNIINKISLQTTACSLLIFGEQSCSIVSLVKHSNITDVVSIYQWHNGQWCRNWNLKNYV